MIQSNSKAVPVNELAGDVYIGENDKLNTPESLKFSSSISFLIQISINVPLMTLDVELLTV